MVTRADLSGNRPLPQIDAILPAASATDARRDSLQRLSQLALGKELIGHVLAALDDGAHLVRVADATVRMALPQGTRAGDTLAMTFIGKEPRPTFLLGPQTGSAPAALSPAGRLIDQLLQAAQRSGASADISGTAPLLPSPDAMDAGQVTAALKDGLAFSGLFYESHLQEWAAGGRALADLAREPQARLGNAAAADAAAANANAARQTDAAASAKELSNGLLLRTAATPDVDAELLLPAQTIPAPIEPEAAKIIHQQLHTLEQQHVRWQGELSPGQPMEWEVGRDAPESRDGAPEQQVWTSVVRFELPTLGAVSGTVRLIGDRVHVQIGAASEDAAQALRTFSGRLADALDAAGSPLDSFLVKRDGAA